MPLAKAKVCARSSCTSRPRSAHATATSALAARVTNVQVGLESCRGADASGTPPAQAVALGGAVGRVQPGARPARSQRRTHVGAAGDVLQKTDSGDRSCAKNPSASKRAWMPASWFPTAPLPRQSWHGTAGRHTGASAGGPGAADVGLAPTELAKLAATARRPSTRWSRQSPWGIHRCKKTANGPGTARLSFPCRGQLPHVLLEALGVAMARD